MDPVVHFEMPYDNGKRMAKFYKSVFGWRTKALGPDMGNYVLATTTDTNEAGPVRPGAINGGFYLKEEEPECMSIVIAVDRIKTAVKKVIAAGGKMVRDPVDIPGVGRYASFIDTEGNRVTMLQPVPNNWHAPETKKKKKK